MRQQRQVFWSFALASKVFAYIIHSILFMFSYNFVCKSFLKITLKIWVYPLGRHIIKIE